MHGSSFAYSAGCSLADQLLFAAAATTGVVQPFIALLRRKLTLPQIGAVIFAAMVILPFTLIISECFHAVQS
jgi:hypothetical protein